MEPILPATGARSLASLNDHLLEEVLVRIRAPADLARASAVCKAFRNIVTDPTFLRRYRSLQPPLLLGGLGTKFHPASTPHPNAPAASAFARTADLDFRHLPPPLGGARGWKRGLWHSTDARDGRVLRICADLDGDLVSPELVVCDPLTRRYTLLPAIPDDLLASVRVQVPDEYVNFWNAFFVPSGVNDGSQFRVMCQMPCSLMAVVFVYSSVSGSWTHGSSIFWSALGLNVHQEGQIVMCGLHSYAYGCLYWHANTMNKLIKLDTNSLVFSTVSLPSKPDHEYRSILVVEAGEGGIGMFSLTLIYGSEYPRFLQYSIRQNETGNANELPVDTTIPLPSEYDFYNLAGAEQGYLFLMGYSDHPVERTAFFSLEIKTLKIERVCLSSAPDEIIPYFGFPPLLSQLPGM